MTMRHASAALFALLAAGCTSTGGVEHYNLPGRTDTLPFSHVVRVGDTFYVAGTLGIDPVTGTPPADLETEIRAMLDDFARKLALADLSMDDLVSTEVYCPDPSLYTQFNAIYASYFQGPPPARAFIGSGPLLRGARFEIKGIAARR
jgi:2-iminobutanoate/2-iminopropanoate deaminase